MTTVTIHQPYYLPWLGLFEKILKSDIFVFLDNVTYSKNGYANRNRIKTPEGSQWLTIPIVQKGISRTPINKVKISNAVDWRRKHWNSIKFNYGGAPHFKKYGSFFEELYRLQWVLLADLNKFLIKTICIFLGIHGTFVDASELGVKGSKSELLVNICEALDADTYFSGRAGRDYLDCQRFEQRGIKVVFQDFQPAVYPQLFGEFIPNLSVIDYLFNVGMFVNEKHDFSYTHHGENDP